jgi:acyl-CoA thioesterase-1
MIPMRCTHADILIGVLVFAAACGLEGCEQELDRSHVTSGSVRSGEMATTSSTTFAGRNGTEERAREDEPTIVAFGNSLTAGFGVASEESYPAQLQRRLNEAGYRYRVVNAGVSGETTAGGLRRVGWVLKSRPRIVILELGANDGLRGFDPAQIRNNLEQIIEKLKAADVQVVLAGMKLPPNYGVDYTSRFVAIYPDLARKHQLTYMPFFLEGVGAQPTLNQPDGIHPTGTGYRIIVDHLFPVLTPLLQRQDAPVR